MPEIAKILSISKSSTKYILQQLDYVSYFNVWIPINEKKKTIGLYFYVQLITYIS